jgi:hypothetical protein
VVGVISSACPESVEGSVSESRNLYFVRWACPESVEGACPESVEGRPFDSATLRVTFLIKVSL